MRNLVPDMIILGLLAVKPAHGYELLERFKDTEQLGRIWNMSTSQIYAVLNRLSEEGAISGETLTAKDGPPRIQYSITDKGLLKVQSWLYDPHPPTSVHRIRVMFLSRLFIADKLGMPLSSIFDQQIHACRTHYQQLSRKKQAPLSWIEELALDYVLNQLDSLLTWLEEKKCSIV